MSTRKMTKRQWILLAGGAALAAVPMGVLAPIASAEPQIQPPQPVKPKSPLQELLSNMGSSDLANLF